MNAYKDSTNIKNLALSDGGVKGKKVRILLRYQKSTFLIKPVYRDSCGDGFSIFLFSHSLRHLLHYRKDFQRRIMPNSQELLTNTLAIFRLFIAAIFQTVRQKTETGKQNK
jgi:hypothetical protein